jgi:hypothetical protein
MRKTGGFQGFLETLFGIGGTVNPYDSVGHFTRAEIPTNVCFDYTSILQPGCEAKFVPPIAAAAAARQMALELQEPIETADATEQEGRADGRPARDEGPPGGEEEPLEEEAAPDEEDEQVGAVATEGASKRSMRDLLEFMIGSPEGGER